MIDINTPLPGDIRPGDPAPWADPEIWDLLTRKTNALWNIQPQGDGINIHRSDSAVTVEIE